MTTQVTENIRSMPAKFPFHQPFARLLTEPAEVYHAKAKDYLTSHQLREFHTNPLLYRKRQLGLVANYDRSDFLIGSALHTYVLEGQVTYRRRYAFGGPTNPRTGKHYLSQSQAFQEWAERQGKPVLTDTQAALVEEMAFAVQQHPIARELFADGVAESVLRGTYCEMPCQARFDWLHPTLGLVDLKTCYNLSHFEEDVTEYGYVQQQAFYRAVLLVNEITIPDVFLVAVEKREPYRCGVWAITRYLLEQATQENEQAIARLRHCHQEELWLTGYEELRRFEPAKN